MTIDIAKLVLAAHNCDSFTVDTTKNRTVIKFKTDYDRKAILDDMGDYLLKNYGGCYNRVYRSHYSRSSGHLEIDGFYFVAKPLNFGATENLNLSGCNFGSFGNLETVKNLNGFKNIECYSFVDPDDLQFSIEENLYFNSKISLGIEKTFHNFFNNLYESPYKFEWDESVTLSEKHELGKYLGEILPGLYFLAGIPFYTSPKRKFNTLLLPVSSRFPCLDSAMISTDNKITSISSKFGTGAKTAFFTNLMPMVINEKRKIKSSWVLKNLLRMYENNDHIIKETIYEYGVREILGFSESVIEKPFRDVYLAIMEGRSRTPEILKVVNAIKGLTANEAILSRLNAASGFSSITGFFTRELANDLNDCAGSMQFLEDLISSKVYVQMSLNPKQWVNGIIEFDFLSSKSAALRIDGAKNSFCDITGKHGLLNYTIS